MNLEFERRCWAEINLDQLRENFSLIQKAASNRTIMAVVKANAYGHGDLAIARALEAAGASFFAVSGLTEAISLRKAGIVSPILVLGYTSPQNVFLLAEHDIRQCVFSYEYGAELSASAIANSCVITVHLKVDTGMGRLGFSATDHFSLALQEIEQTYILKGLSIEGIFTHFSAADSSLPTDIEYTKKQMVLFKNICSSLVENGYTFQYYHSCNSAGIIISNQFLEHNPAFNNLVRPGIILYGCNPSETVCLPQIKPIFILKAIVTMVKVVSTGDSLSYGRTFTTTHPTKIATLSVGYADGYPRSLSNKGVVSIHGKPAKILGRVCMDQMIVDVSDIEEVQLGDTAVIFGDGAADSIDDVALKSGTINYEILCNIGQRVQRVYFENGKETMLADYIGGII